MYTHVVFITDQTGKCVEHFCDSYAEAQRVQTTLLLLATALRDAPFVDADRPWVEEVVIDTYDPDAYAAQDEDTSPPVQYDEDVPL